ncbi:MAG: PH domain-containing protein [Xanthomonadales bacterium]|nr:PH domain-containing protein [Xanthomonadales bacterium]
MAPEARGGERRLHPFSWLFVLITQLREVAFPLVLLLLFGRGQWWEFLAIVGAVLLALYSLVYSFGFRYRIGADELVVREGIFDRTERHIPFARIQNIARRSNVLHRAFGVTELRLESGGGSRPEAVMKVLRLADADALVLLLRARRPPLESQSSAADGAVVAAAGEELLTLPVGELLRLGLISNRGMVVVAGAFAAFWQFDPGGGKHLFRPAFNLAKSLPAKWRRCMPDRWRWRSRLPCCWRCCLRCCGCCRSRWHCSCITVSGSNARVIASVPGAVCSRTHTAARASTDCRCCTSRSRCCTDGSGA